MTICLRGRSDSAGIYKIMDNLIVLYGRGCAVINFFFARRTEPEASFASTSDRLRERQWFWLQTNTPLRIDNERCLPSCGAELCTCCQDQQSATLSMNMKNGAGGFQ